MTLITDEASGPAMTKATVGRITQFVSLLFGGIFAGFVTAVLVIELPLRAFDRHVYTQVRKIELVGLDILAIATLVPAILATAVLLLVAVIPGGRGRRLTAAALALLVLIFIVSLVVNVPINSLQLTWDVQAPPPDWADLRDRWQIAHVVRTGAALLAFAFLSVAALSRVPPSSRGEGR